TRDPWKNPTLLFTPESFKGSRGGFTLQGDGDYSNFVLDGFVFDKKANNVYNETGDLVESSSDHSPHLSLTRPGCVMRNCLVINGAEGGVVVASGGTVENCIFFNNRKWVVQVQGGFTPTVPIVFRNNTVAFAWDELFGEGHGRTGDLLMLQAPAIIENNIS